MSNEHQPSSLQFEGVEAHFRALRRALRAKRVATLSDLALLLASDNVPLPDAIDLLAQAAAGDRRAIELAQLRLVDLRAKVPGSKTPPLAAMLILGLERHTATN